MNSRLTPLLAAAILGASFAAGAAQASVTTVTFAGKVTKASDLRYGLGSQPQVGADFTATFHLDDAKGASVFLPNGSAYDNYLQPDTTDLTGVSVAMGGVNFDFRCNESASSFCWYGLRQQDGPASSVYASLEIHGLRFPPGHLPGQVDDFLAFTVGGGNDMLPSPDYRTPFTYARTTPIGGGMFRIYEDTPNAVRGSGEVAFYSITVTSDAPPPGVPEPAAWALMILGFGATGAALRRRAASPTAAG